MIKIYYTNINNKHSDKIKTTKTRDSKRKNKNYLQQEAIIVMFSTILLAKYFIN